jgi:predicted MFS family arabinose efflux permease
MMGRHVATTLEPGQPSAAPPAAGQGWLVAALALALAAAVSLGLARFAYGLLLPAMRADLGWTYFTAGAMNTANAAGYLAGALLAPAAFARVDARRVLLAGGWAAAVLLALHGLVRSDAALYALRFATGTASAASFVAGGLLAARLAGRAGPGRSGLVLGLYYGGTGLGIVAGSLAVPTVLPDADATAWPAAWWLLAAVAAGGSLVTTAGTHSLAQPPAAVGARLPVRHRDFAAGLAGYAMFGLGYIGYMTFAITLLREQGYGSAARTAFFVLVGLGVIASSWLWAGLLQRHRDGRPLAVLNGLLAVATLLPVLSIHPVAVYASGALFGAVFLSVVASTTAWVRHNLAPAAWPSGIAAFTIVFAAGQIVGPGLVGRVADGAGGLLPGFGVSAALLALGAVLALFQRALPR